MDDEIELLTLLSSEGAANVGRVLPAGLRALRAANFPAFLNELRKPRQRVLIVDPAMLTEYQVAQIASEVNRTRSSLLLVGPLTSATARRTAIATLRTSAHLVVLDCESTDPLLRLELHRLHNPSIRASLLNAISPTVSRLPVSLCAAVIALFGRLPLPQSVDSFVDRVGLVRRSVDRWTRRAGFRSTGLLLRSVRLAWAWELARSTTRASEQDLWEVCGYTSVRTLRTHSKALLGVASRALAHTIVEKTHIERLRAGAIAVP
jgi:hypothetical protein